MRVGATELMRLILRLTGTWMLAMALILLIIDGTRSLGDNALVFTSFGDAWTLISAESLAEVRAFLQSRFFGPLLDATIEGLLALPVWVVLAAPGACIAWLGRSRRTRLYVRHDQV